MREACVVLMAGQIGLSETVTRTVVAATLEDAVAEFGVMLRAEADSRGKWCEVTKAELVGRCVITEAAKKGGDGDGRDQADE